MPDIKEKLVELIGDCKWWGSCEDTVDHLLDNGVTIQKWISVDERLPEVNETVLAHYQDGHIEKDFRLSWGGFVLDNLYGGVTHWMPMPEPPAEEVLNLSDIQAPDCETAG